MVTTPVIDTRVIHVMECDGDCRRTVETEDGQQELEAKASALGWKIIRYAHAEMNTHYCPEHK